MSKRFRITRRLPMPKPSQRHGDKRKELDRLACRLDALEQAHENAVNHVVQLSEVFDGDAEPLGKRETS